MNRTILITGANRGIGLELCRQLAASGDRVLATCRHPSEALEALDVEVHEGFDVRSPESIAGFADRISGVSLDWLINNAGVARKAVLGSIDYDTVAFQFEVNAMGPLRVTEALLDELGKGAKVGIITSRMGSIEDNTSGSAYGYRMSKAAVNIAGKSLALDLEPRGISVALLHPGLVATDMTDHSGIPVSESASGLIQRMEALDLSNTGTFWHASGEVLPW